MENKDIFFYWREVSMNEKLRNLKNKKVIFLVISIIIAFIFGMFFASSLKGKEEKVKETSLNSTVYNSEVLEFLNSIAGIKAENLEIISDPVSLKGTLFAPKEAILNGINYFLAKTENEKPDIKFDDVSLNYKDHPIYQNLNFDLAYGKKILLQGPSGSGKSTLLNMVSGLLKPSHGTIKIGDENPNPAQSVYIPQTPWLFQGTIKDNLCLGESFTDQQLLQVLSEVGLADELGKDPLNRIIHPEQEDLSGGQRQRLVIARALLRDRPIILLDEITAALDEKNSDDIREILYNTPKTIIESAHHINFDLTKKYGFESWMIEDHHLVNNK